MEKYGAGLLENVYLSGNVLIFSRKYAFLDFICIALHKEEIWYFSVAIVKFQNQFALNQGFQGMQVHSAPIKAEATNFICPDVQGVNKNTLVAMLVNPI